MDGVEIFDGRLYKFPAYDDVVVIPQYIDGQKVSVLGDELFKGCSNVKEFILPDSLTAIGNHTFEKCTSMESIHIPHDVIISSSSFDGCSSLRVVHMDDGCRISFIPTAFKDCGKVFIHTMDEGLINLLMYGHRNRWINKEITLAPIYKVDENNRIINL